eukprot:5887911-Pyramimonas_sp.AAC.1
MPRVLSRPSGVLHAELRMVRRAFGHEPLLIPTRMFPIRVLPVTCQRSFARAFARARCRWDWSTSSPLDFAAGRRIVAA